MCVSVTFCLSDCSNKKCVCILVFRYITKCMFPETEKFLKSLQLLNKTSVQHVWVRTCVHHSVYNINSWVYLLRCVLVPSAHLSSLQATGRYAPLSLPVLSSPLPFAQALSHSSCCMYNQYLAWQSLYMSCRCVRIRLTSSIFLCVWLLQNGHEYNCFTCFPEVFHKAGSSKILP